MGPEPEKKEIGGLVTSVDEAFLVTSVDEDFGYLKLGTVAARTTSSRPDEYRLARTKDGELVLQGWYQWSEGAECGGDWETIPTINLD